MNEVYHNAGATHLLMKTAIALCIFAMTFLAVGAPPMQDIERKSDLELVNLLTNGDSEIRCASLIVLGLRFDDPNVPMLMSQILTETHPKEVALPPVLLERTVSLAKSDEDLRVRLAAVIALGQFRFRTNTAPILMALLRDRICIIRIRAAQALIDFEDDYHEPICGSVVPTLISCLDTNNSPDDIWQAAETLGDLGAQAKEALPLLTKLKHNESREVREYVREVARKIRKQMAARKN